MINGLKAGKVVASIPHSYLASAPQGRSLLTAPADRGTVYTSEHEWFDKRGRVVKATGRMMLDAISLPAGVGPASEIDQGWRLAAYAANPKGFGGRLALLADQYEECRINRLRLEYEPSVSAIEAGAIAMYFRNDIATPTTDVGRDELLHAATHPDFKQTVVRNDAALEINPVNANSKYFDEGTGDFRFSVQGVIQVITASTFPADTVGATMGNLYLVYDYDFFSEELDYDVSDVASGNASLVLNAYDTTEGQAVIGSCAASSAGVAALVGVGGIGLSNSDALLIATITSTSGSVISAICPDGSAGFDLQVGQVLYVRFQNNSGANVFTDGSINAVFFRDLESASSPGADGAHGDGIILYASTAAGVNAAIQFNVRSMDLSN
jgi:hypothetical protein